MFLCRCRLGLMALELWPVRQSMMDRRQLASAVMFCVLAMLLGSTMAFTPPGADTRTFATFGNAHTKQLIQSWQPKPLAVPNGSVLTPASQENMKRFVRARILLEDPSLGCVASFDDALCVILCRFNKAEHSLLLPLWRPEAEATQIFKDLSTWHKEHFSLSETPPRLSGAHLEADAEAWNQIARE